MNRQVNEYDGVHLSISIYMHIVMKRREQWTSGYTVVYAQNENLDNGSERSHTREIKTKLTNIIAVYVETTITLLNSVLISLVWLRSQTDRKKELI
jgi:hypothetical protein